MVVNCKCSRIRGGRVVLGLLVCGCVALGLFWYVSQASAAKDVAPVAEVKVVGQVPSDKPKITKEELLSRFPQEKHEEFMRRAIANSRKAGVQYKTGGAFGAVIVTKEGDVIADGLNHVVGENDPTWHGEMHAIRQACALLKSPKLEGCILYTSSEPCPMCLATAYWAGVDGIIYGALVEDSKKYGNFDDAFIYEQFAKPSEDRTIPQVNMLRPEAVEVWKEYSERTDKVDY